MVLWKLKIDTNNMQKPIKPIKPLKHAGPPSDIESVERVVMLDNTRKVVLLSPEQHEKYNKDEGMMQWEVDGLDNFSERKKYSDVLKFKAALPLEVEDFEFGNNVNSDGYYECTTITYKVPKNEIQYQNELDEYNNRFSVYGNQLKEYEKKMAVYDVWKKQQKIEKLKDELDKYEKTP